MKHIKAPVALIAAGLGVLILLLHTWYTGTKLNHAEVHTTTAKSLKPIIDATESDTFKIVFDASESWIDTPGCRIPQIIINFAEDAKTNKIKKKSKMINRPSCGKRAITLKRSPNQDHVKVNIKKNTMKNYLRDIIFMYCCYKFIGSFDVDDDNKERYYECKKTKDGDMILLETDFVNIKCFAINKQNVTVVIYDDIYAFAKRKINTNYIFNRKNKYNILILGMDSMSLSRFLQTMPLTSALLKDDGWMNFRGYNKIGDNTFPNLMAALTGLDVNYISKKCYGNMDFCNRHMIWSEFKRINFTTAYGEDYTHLPDTFSGVNGFSKQPTDHYLRPLFMHSENEKHKTLVCTGMVSSAETILDFALDYAFTYHQQPFFGLFWLNSFSHNVDSCPKNADKTIQNFFKKLTNININNTFLIFMSDHGIRFGPRKMKTESYYDDRLPFLFMKTPNEFKSNYQRKYNSAVINQFRLVTPYDLYNTLIDIGQMSNSTFGRKSEGCSNCHSLFEIANSNRTCSDVGIDDKWCSCHQLQPLDIGDPIGLNLVNFVAKHMSNSTKSIKTKPCWVCLEMTLEKVERMHYYNDPKGMFYVVAFVMSPESLSYESTVSIKDDEYKIVGPISFISKYKGLGSCAAEHRQRLFCVCQKLLKCTV